MNPAMKLLKGRQPKTFLRRRKHSLYKKTYVPNFLPCSHAFLNMLLTVLAVKLLKRKVMTSEWTNRTLLPYSRPFLSPLKMPSIQQSMDDIINYQTGTYHTSEVQNNKRDDLTLFSSDQYLMKIIRTLGRKIIFAFSEDNKPKRGFRNFMKAKQIQEKMSPETMTTQQLEAYNYSHRMLYVPFMPAVLLSLPAMYFFSTPVDPMLLKSCNLLQYYSSGLLCFNAFFTQEHMAKYLPFLLGVGLANCFTGYLSLASPIILACLSIYVPFTDDKWHKIETEQHGQKYKPFLFVRALFNFMLSIILTLKFYHFMSIREMEKKIEGYEKQNSSHFQKQTQES